LSLKLRAVNSVEVQMLKFPNEENHSIHLRSAIQSQFDLAERAYSYWLKRPENSYLLESAQTLWSKNVNVPLSTIRVAMTLNVQMCRLFRSIVDESSRLESFCANILTRSLYETILLLDYILRDEVVVFISPIMIEDPINKGQKKQKEEDNIKLFMAKPSSKRSDDTRVVLRRKQRANFYLAHDYLNRKQQTELLAKTPGMENVAKQRMDEDDPLLLQKIRDVIGDTWYSILKHAGYCSGLSVQDLVSVLDPAFRG